MKTPETPATGDDPFAASRRFSAGALARLHAELAAREPALQGLECLAVAGSLARGEAGPASDVDCVLVAKQDAGPAASEAAVAAVLDAAGASGLRRPRADGIFRATVTARQLLDPAAAGRLDEPPAVYGKRLQLLTDTRPVLGAACYRALRGRVLDWFTAGEPQRQPFGFLVSELIRYRRSYCAYQRFRFAADDADGWHLRMVKLGGSRLITVAGLLLLLGEGSLQHDPRAWVEARLDRSPLERVLTVMGERAPAAAEHLVQCYGRLHRAVADPAARRRLLAQPAVSRETLGRGEAVMDPEIARTLDTLGALVNDFLLDQRGRWPDRLFRGMLL